MPNAKSAAIVINKINLIVLSEIMFSNNGCAKPKSVKLYR